jgi:hypothetical protein
MPSFDDNQWRAWLSGRAPTVLEKETAQLACMLDNIRTGSPWRVRNWDGWHPAVYCKANERMRDGLFNNLHYILQNTGTDGYCLEIVQWWETHKEAEKYI